MLTINNEELYDFFEKRMKKRIEEGKSVVNKAIESAMEEMSQKIEEVMNQTDDMINSIITKTELDQIEANFQNVDMTDATVADAVLITQEMIDDLNTDVRKYTDALIENAVEELKKELESRINQSTVEQQDTFMDFPIIEG